MEEQIIQHLPKIELHCHLDGSVRPHILERLAQEQGNPLPYSSAELASKLTAPEDCESLLEYLERFDIVLPYLQTAEAIELISYDLIEQVAEENVAYIEVRFAPLLFAHQGLTINQIVEAVIAGLKRGEEVFGVKSNALLCGMRHHTNSDNKAVVEATKNYLNNGVVGFDIAGDEAQFPADLYTDLITLAKKYAIPLTLHAGECGCPQNVLTSIKLGATRVGHGIAIAKDDAILAECKERGTVIEMCPTSNFQTKAVTKLEDYPFKKFMDAGLNICINTDNRTVSNTTLTKEYTKLHKWYNIDYRCMEQLNHNAVNGAFISDNEKEQLHTLLKTAYYDYK
ncbi:adenosine deaminase [Vagococcus coleopterorum]|uniref:Adenosine deaminase n=1 Tax=Vagococcus coleopterorum TaxID=2714946 RepID=A0A6G8ALB7_9ENTE|nr:adenosine deaminase [Vagococcus coleopterorum]QIL45884.1 adenosine deaminase [Vagococcus coleopterorum]